MYRNVVKFERAVFETCEQRDRHPLMTMATDKQAMTSIHIY